MDRINRNSHLLIWVSFVGAVLAVLSLKSQQLGWFQPRPPLELNGQPAVLVFVRFQGRCECEQFVNDNARTQIINWSSEARLGTPIHLIAIDQRPDLAKRYNIIRAPSMLLLNAAGEIVWRQDGVTEFTSDEAPLDLVAAEAQIAGLWTAEEMRTP